MATFLAEYSQKNGQIYRNESVPKLVEFSLRNEENTSLSSTGSLVVTSGIQTGRSPKDKYICDGTDNIWWGSPYHKKISASEYAKQKSRALDYLSTKNHLFVFDGFAGWDKEHRIKVRVICTSAYHAIFMNNMLIRPTKKELELDDFVDLVIYNAGEMDACEINNSKTCVAINLLAREMIILGTQYAGEMKKGVFTFMNYIMPKRNFVSMHSSVNISKTCADNISLFFGLSGTGKTTLSTDPHRCLIGDDEHVWTNDGLFNIEGGCYAKCIGLSAEKEPDIYNAIKFGSIQENVVYHKNTRIIDYNNSSITQNTRCAYPINFINNAKIPAICGHPTNIIFLTCDAFGVLPPVAKLTPKQAMYHFISGYTSKVAGTEMGVIEPIPVFSACYGGPFLVWHPIVYANILSEKIKKHNVHVWLVNTGWIGGAYGEGTRIKLSYTRHVINSIHDGSLMNKNFIKFPIFNFMVPTGCYGVPNDILFPKNTWDDGKKYDESLHKLAKLFMNNFKQFDLPTVVQNGPIINK